MSMKIFSISSKKWVDILAHECYYENVQEMRRTNEIFRKDEFAIEVVAYGSTLDDDPGFHTVFQIDTWMLRVNHKALRLWSISEEAFENQIEKELGIHTSIGVTVKQVVSEIFSVVFIHEENRESA